MTLSEKYRPRTLGDVVGQDKALRALRQLSTRTIGGRAFWISGSSGVGKSSLAKIIADMIAEPFHVTQYDSADQFNQPALDRLRYDMTLMAMGKGGRAWIIDEAHGLRKPIIRQLLGILERLPAHCVIIFTTTRAGQASDGVSLDAQAACIRAWCGANGYDVTRVFSDAGVSGKRADKRPRLQAALSDACRLRGTLVVYSLSRLARSTEDAISIAERLDKAGADLVSLTERIDTTTAAGKMVFRMLAVLAEFERDLVSERTTAALAHKRRKGERIGAIPYGWRLADDGATLEPIESEQAVIREMKAPRERRCSFRAIAEELTRRGAPIK